MKLFKVTLIDKTNGISFDIYASTLRIDGEDVYIFSEYDKINKFMLKYYDLKIEREITICNL